MQFNDYKTIKFERNERILTVTLNLPETMNAVGEGLHTELSKLFYDLQTDKGSDIIIITGAGKAFSAGGDVDQMKKNNESKDFDTNQLVEAKKMIFGLLDLEKPIIAKVNGDAMGLGATIALFCDIIFANEEARIADPHVSVGIVAGDGGAVIWPQLIGYARAKHYLMTGSMIKGKEAAEIGLINFSLPLSDLDEKVDSYAKKLSLGSTDAIRWTKVAVNIGLKQLASSIMDVGLGYEAITIRSSDHAEGIASFLEKRKPNYGIKK
jgi:enoyl-CoA hydratase